MKNILTCYLLFVVNFNFYAQDSKIVNCLSDEIHLASMAEPVYKSKYNANRELWQAAQIDKDGKMLGISTPTVPVILTVVFHNMTSVPQETVANYTDIVTGLNKIFSGISPSPLIYNTQTLTDKPNGNNTFIQFCLAEKDINGDHSNTDFASISIGTPRDDSVTVINNSHSPEKYPSNKYINVYIVSDIAGSPSGYAYMPESHGSVVDGIFIESDYLKEFDSNDTNLNYNLNILAHEMGHYLGLYHVFGICPPELIHNLDDNGFNPCSCDNNNCLFNGDMVCDTPPMQLIFGQNCGLQTNTCSTDLPDNFDDKSNYMDYGDSYCHYHFTEGQISRMHFMIDSVTGPRKSLLNNDSCVNCMSMNNCTFNIISGIADHATVIGSTINFSATSNCTANVSYSWRLILLGESSSTVGVGNGIQYTPGNNLQVGNYTLELTATGSIDCFEVVSYNFQIIPVAGTCLLTTADINWTDWSRVSYSGGWSRNQSPPHGYTHATTHRKANGETGFDDSGFDVFAAIDFSDANFSTNIVPSGITNIMRVGRIVNGLNTVPEGNAYFASYTFHPTRENCRYRVYYLGLRESNTSANVAYPEFTLNVPNSGSSFGLVSQYRFDSPANPTIGQDSVIGMGEDGTLFENSNSSFTNNRIAYYGINDMVSDKKSSVSTDFDTNYSDNVRHMTDWKYIDLDFSEFVDVDSDITLTFFSHSNDALNAQESAYAYYSIKCLGGGIPQDFDFAIPDVSLSCDYDRQANCTYIKIPVPPYVYSDPNINYFNYNGLSKLTLSKEVDGEYELRNANLYATGIPYLNLLVCLDGEEQFGDFKIDYITLNKIVSKTFRIYNAFLNNDSICENELFPGGHLNELANANKYHVWCPGETLPQIIMDSPCFSATQYDYHWQMNNIWLNEFDANLDLSNYSSLIAENCEVRFVRWVKYRDPYCDTMKDIKSETFIVYNKGGYEFLIGDTQHNDICINSENTTVEVTVNNFKLKFPNCIPLSILSPQSTTISVQLLIQNTLVGSPHTFNFDALVPNVLASHLSFSFENNPLGIPMFNAGTYDIKLQITYTVDDCPTTKVLDTGTDLVIRISAKGGIIALNNNCNPIDVLNIDSGLTTAAGYGWEIAYDNGPFTPLTAPEISPDNAVSIGNLSLTGISLPALIRRKSFGFGACSADVYSNTLQINDPNTVPIFNLLPNVEICSGTVPPELPSISRNGIVGTWLPSTISNTVAGMYVFTPISGQCTNESFTFTTSIIPFRTPTPLLPSEYCIRDLPVTLSNTQDGIIGLWAPSAIISGAGNYIFSPLTCGGDFNLDVTVFEESVIVIPDFNNLIRSYCLGDLPIILPVIDNNQISGTWFPSVVDTSQSGTATYIFTPTVGGPCSKLEIVITIFDAVELNFNIDLSICEGDEPPSLPSYDIHEIKGIWSPSFVSNIASGIYTFTPLNACFEPLIVQVEVLQNCAPLLTWSSEVSCQSTNDGPKFEEQIADGPCIRVCENSTIKYYLIMGSVAIESTVWQVTGGVIQAQSPTSITITWGTATFCALQGVVTLVNGTQFIINRCIEKVITASPQFTTANAPAMQGCRDNPMYFVNLTTSNDGNQNLYYNWDFGDGATSSAFEPSHVYALGTYTVALTVYNGCSCSSTFTSVVEILESDKIPIDCPTVICEGQTARYSIPMQYAANCPDISWNISGGEVVWANSDNTQVDVFWNNVDKSGFGYISVNSLSCFPCPTMIRVPIIKQVGDIVGKSVVCYKSQNIYSLPQWPTTVYTWSLNDSSTGAELKFNNQRNEVIVQAGSGGTVILKCVYFNTLLGCGGTATFKISVNEEVILEGKRSVCTNSLHTYEFFNETNDPETLPYIINGPNGFMETGTASSLNISFPNMGIYTIDIDSPNHCFNTVSIEAIGIPDSPTEISGALVMCPGIPKQYGCVIPSGAQAIWEVQNGSISGNNRGSEIMVNFDPNATTPYIVSVRYIVDGCSSEPFDMIISKEVPNLSFTVLDNEICESSFGNYAVSNSVGADTYLWTIDPETAGSVQSGQNTNAVSILWNETTFQSQSATVKLEVRKCGSTYFKSEVVSIISTPTITITGDNTICANTTATFGLTLTPASPFEKVIWNFGDGTIVEVLGGNSNSLSVQYNYAYPIMNSTNYIVTAKVIGASGCITPSSANYSVAVSPAPIVYLTPSSRRICLSAGSILYHVNLQSGFANSDTVKWYYDFGPEIMLPVGSDPWTVNVNNFGTGSVFAVVTNSFGCTMRTETLILEICGIQGPGNNGQSTEICDPNAEISVMLSPSCQGVVATLDATGASETYWTHSEMFGDSISVSPTQFTADKLEPGRYSITGIANYIVNNRTCPRAISKEFVIPYKAGLKYTVTCGGSGQYNVKLLDFSVYYPETPIVLYEFTINDGQDWISDDGSETIPHLIAQLAPGSHRVGVKISIPGSLYPPCIEIIDLVLEPMPDASFTHDIACSGNATEFFVTYPQDGSTYLWDFGDQVGNSQQNAIRTYTDDNFNIATLKITNKYGCYTTSTQTVPILQIQMSGDINVPSTPICEGSSINLNYSSTGFNAPVEYKWFHNQYMDVPFATTSSVTVSQSGQYFVYVKSSYGCWYYDTLPITFSPIQLPHQPTITGQSIICLGNDVTLNVPHDDLLIYLWTKNGISVPEWDGLEEIVDNLNLAGNFIYGVTSSYVVSGSTACTSNPSYFNVQVQELPDLPEIIITDVNCEPYSVKLEVSNVQNDVTYYWSNGQTGVAAIITHDGPIQVRAEKNGCSVTSQVVLPVDLGTIAWVFPNGCYNGCNINPLNGIIGPFGSYEGWAWLQNHLEMVIGNGIIPPFTQVLPGKNYQLQLDNGYCEVELQNLTIGTEECKECDMNFNFREIELIIWEEQCIYQVSIDVYNPHPNPFSATVSMPGGYGFFINSTILLPSGNSNHTLLFYPINGFTGGVVSQININGHWNGQDCFLRYAIDFPKLDCTDIDHRVTDLDLDLNLNLRTLIVAPNPTFGNTAILYRFTDKSEARHLEVVDMLGRVLLRLSPRLNSGTEQIDMSRYAAGQYMVLMKEDMKTVLSTKLIVK